jgi:hypothetical protein
MHLHWDGDNDSVDERNLSAGLGAGITPVTVDHAGLKRVRDWIWTLPPPKYPFAIDMALAARGAPIYSSNARRATATPLQGRRQERRPRRPGRTDRPHPDRSSSPGFVHGGVRREPVLAVPDSRYRFTHFRKTDGYANQPLDGIWARAPYLHNGSVPSLRDLLEPAERRPRDVLPRLRRLRPGQGRVRRRTSKPLTAAPSPRYDTSIAGNGNGGHDYGTTLPDEDKRAIVEYLKTF